MTFLTIELFFARSLTKNWPQQNQVESFDSARAIFLNVQLWRPVAGFRGLEKLMFKEQKWMKNVAYTLQ